MFREPPQRCHYPCLILAGPSRLVPDRDKVVGQFLDHLRRVSGDDALVVPANEDCLLGLDSDHAVLALPCTSY